LVWAIGLLFSIYSTQPGPIAFWISSDTFRASGNSVEMSVTKKNSTFYQEIIKNNYKLTFFKTDRLSNNNYQQQYNNYVILVEKLE
jgi:hypothetical protein